MLLIMLVYMEKGMHDLVFLFRSKSSKFEEIRLRDQFLFLSMKINDETNTCYTANGRLLTL